MILGSGAALLPWDTPESERAITDLSHPVRYLGVGDVCVREPTMLSAFGVTDRGRIRPTNEDCFGIDPGLEFCVVADGMGGHNAGEVASRLAVEAVLDYVANNAVTTTWPYGYDAALSDRANLLRTAVQVANTRVFEAAAASPGMPAWGPPSSRRC